MIEDTRSDAPADPPGAGRRSAWFVLTTVTFASLVLLRATFELGFLLPVPLGDSVIFLEASVHLCRTGEFANGYLAIEALGTRDFVWHGYLSPWLYGLLSWDCRPRSFYLLNFGLKLLTAALLLRALAANGQSFVVASSVALLAFAVQSLVGFRPESLALLWIVLSYWALLRGRDGLAAAAAALLLWTQPTLFLLFGVTALLAETEACLRALRRGAWLIGLGVAGVLAWLYPHSLLDLGRGLWFQARHLAGRDGSGAVPYLLLTHFLPFWSLVFAWAWWLRVRHAPLFALSAVPYWWFGLRVPFAAYNLYSWLPWMVWLGLQQATPAARFRLAIAALSIAVAGLGLASARDLATVWREGDSYARARQQFLSDWSSPHLRVLAFPTYARLWAPLAESEQQAKTRVRAEVRHFPVSGAASSPCPTQVAKVPPTVLFGIELFRSNSGWMTYRCLARMPPEMPP